MIPKLPTSLNPHVSLRLIQVYCDSGDLPRARQLFDKIPDPNRHSWTILIGAYTKWGFPNEALKLYSDLQKRSVEPDRLVLLSAVKACASSRNLAQAHKIHEDAIRFGFHLDTKLGNALIDMYGKCTSVEAAAHVFSELPIKDVVSWTSLLSCYVNCGCPSKALVAFRDMSLNGLRPNPVTVSTVLPACSDLKDLKMGKQIHGYVVKSSMEDNVFITSALVDMYSSCLKLRHAQLVFDSMSTRDTVAWNTILTAYFSNGECEKAQNLFSQMRTEKVTLNYDSWNAVIGGSMQNGKNREALDLLTRMQESGLKPNQITVTSILPACTNLESLRSGKEIHGYVYRNLISGDMTTTTALIYMYAKCGVLELSRRVFKMMPRKDTVAWNTMIIANSMHGNGEEALALLKDMMKSGVRANSVTFTGVLSGCSHSRLVDEGLKLFYSMSSGYLVEPDVDHYGCMVDILSRAGRLDEALKFIQRMPMEATASAWGALLAGCRVHKIVELARIASKRLFEIEPENPGNYVLLSNILVNAKLWGEASETRKLMRGKGITKAPGCSWIQVKNRVFTFVVGDQRNEQSEKIYKFLDDVCHKMKMEGYIPNTEFVLQDLDQEDKEEVLCSHSEKVAVAFGILNLGGEPSIRVFKNLRICGDCHNVIKFMAKIFGVQITVRDSLRFHHFKNGTCSCGDFW